MKYWMVVFSVATAGAMCLVSSGVVSAAVLPTDGVAISGFKGSQAFSATVSTLVMHANVDYAVYAPGAFNTSGPLNLNHPTDPSGGTQYVYAYQLSNIGTGSDRSVGELSVGLNGNQLPSNLGLIAPTPAAFGLSPDLITFVPASAPYSSATWTRTSELTLSQSTTILIFTSPNPPAFFNSSVLGGGLSSQQQLPSPIPEPATISVVMGITLAVLAGRGRRR